MHAFANPRRFLALAVPLTPWFFWSGVALILVGCWAGLFLAPADYLQGDSFRILYIHVPAAWLGMGAWVGMTIAAIMQLVWRHPLAAIAGRAIALPGAVFTAVCLATGSIWGRPTWGIWWRWEDARLVSMLLLLFLYLGYLALARASAERAEAGGISQVTAIFALVGALNLPVIHISVTWLNSLHQGPSITFSGSSIDPSMLWPLGLTVLGFSFWFGAIVLLRMRALLAENRIEARLRRLARA